MNKYIVINKTILEEKIIELKKEYNEKAIHNDNQWCSLIAGKILSLEYLLAQSTPLIPIIEKSFNYGQNYNQFPFSCKDMNEYISNLKLNI